MSSMSSSSSRPHGHSHAHGRHDSMHANANANANAPVPAWKLRKQMEKAEKPVRERVNLLGTRPSGAAMWSSSAAPAPAPAPTPSPTTMPSTTPSTTHVMHPSRAALLLREPVAPREHHHIPANESAPLFVQPQRSSRLVFKNIPADLTDDKLRAHVSAFTKDTSAVTDVRIMRAPNGLSRKFAFVGFRNADLAEAAQRYFDRTFIYMSRLQVTFAVAPGQGYTDRPWSKYNELSSRHPLKHTEIMTKKQQHAAALEAAAAAAAATASASGGHHGSGKGVSMESRKSALAALAKSFSLTPDQAAKLENDPLFFDYLNTMVPEARRKFWDNDESSQRFTDMQHADAERQRIDANDSDDDEYFNNPSIDSLNEVRTSADAAAVGAPSSSSSSSQVNGSAEEGEGETKSKKKGKKEKTKKSKMSKKSKGEGEGEDAAAGDDDSASAPSDVVMNEEISDLEYLKMRKSTNFDNDFESDEDERDVTRMTSDGRALLADSDGEEGGDDDDGADDGEDEDKEEEEDEEDDDDDDDDEEDDDDEDDDDEDDDDDAPKTEEKQDEANAQAPSAPPAELDMRRLYVVNLPYSCTETGLLDSFSVFGEIASLHMPLDQQRQCKGFAYVAFEKAQDAERAMNTLNGSILMGRLAHIQYSWRRDEPEGADANASQSYKKKKELELKKLSQQSYNWNTLYLRSDAVMDAIASKLGVSKSSLLDSSSSASLAVRVALAESALVAETKQFLENNGVALLAAADLPDPTLKAKQGAAAAAAAAMAAAKAAAAQPRSRTLILVKNLPFDSTTDELQSMFSKFGDVKRVSLAPSHMIAVVEMPVPAEARRAFLSLSYRKFHHVPLYLEWAPVSSAPSSSANAAAASATSAASASSASSASSSSSNAPSSFSTLNLTASSKAPASASPAAVAVAATTSASTTPAASTTAASASSTSAPSTAKNAPSLPAPPPGSAVFVKNLNFATSEATVEQFCRAAGRVHSVTIAKKKNSKASSDPTQPAFLSMGYGFIQFSSPAEAERAVNTLNGKELDGHVLELKISTRATKSASSNTGTGASQGQQQQQQQQHTKLIVKNVPFEATVKELRELFSTFGQLKRVTLPKKFDGSHRGFAFVEFLTHQEALNAVQSVHATHLYGRHLVLEWSAAGDEVASAPDTDEQRARVKRQYEAAQKDMPAHKRARKADGGGGGAGDEDEEDYQDRMSFGGEGRR